MILRQQFSLFESLLHSVQMVYSFPFIARLSGINIRLIAANDFGTLSMFKKGPPLGDVSKKHQKNLAQLFL